MRWEVQSVSESKGEDDGDYLDRVVEAYDGEAAAREAVARWWNEDPGGTLPSAMPVKVRAAGGPDDGAWIQYRVSGEPDINWRATKMKTESESES